MDQWYKMSYIKAYPLIMRNPQSQSATKIYKTGHSNPYVEGFIADDNLGQLMDVYSEMHITGHLDLENDGTCM